MESRDSLPSSSPSTNNRDAPSAAAEVDDGLFALAKDAAMHYQSGKFVECLEVMNQLLQKKPEDPKVLHNIAIAEFFRDGCSDPKKLLEVIYSIKFVQRKYDEHTLTSGDQGEPVNNVANKVAFGSKGSNSTDTMHPDEFESTAAALNIAIIWFHLHDYAKTVSVLEPLFQRIDPITDSTALHICLLLLDASLACHDASKSADVLTYLERLFSGTAGQGDYGNTAQPQSANLTSKSAPVTISESAADPSSSDLGSSANTPENNLSRTLSEDGLDYEAMILDMGGQNLTRPMGPSSNVLSRALVDRFSSLDLKLKLQLYKVQFLILTRNLKIAKREVKLAMNIARGRDSSRALLLKSQLEYARGNHRKAIKLLMASSNNRTDTEFSSIFNNNLGCIYYQLGKYQTSSIFFSKALTNCSSLRKEQQSKLTTFSQDISLLIIYNCGVQHLACGKPILAARCFQKASLVFYKQPLLWLRLSECCLMALEKGLIKSCRVPSEKLEVGACVVGLEKWRQLVVKDQIPGNGHLESSRGNERLPSEDGGLKLSMSLARQCLLNALHLLDSYSTNRLKSGLPSNSSVENDTSEVLPSKNSSRKNSHVIDPKAFSVAAGLGQINSNGDTKEQKGGASQELFQNSLSYYEDVCRRDNQLVKQAVLANLAYVELELDNPVKALAAAKSLFELPECSRIYIFLGHVYAAEALCLLNRPKEAAEYLSYYLSGGNNVDLPFSQDDCEKLQVERTVEFEEVNVGSTAAKSCYQDTQSIVFLKPEEARATIYANFAVMSAMQGEFEKASMLVTQALSILPNSPEATLTAVYVDLLLGKQQEALAKLKSCSRIRFLPSGITLNKSS
ncbi:unnamed protein product [Lathyrus sativus]|nr:unnamed protein product [Lathyrus sativus]